MIPAHVSQRPVAQVAIAGAQYELLMVEEPVPAKPIYAKVPDDFADQAHRTTADLAAHYGVHAATIRTYRRKLGLPQMPNRVKDQGVRARPDDFGDLAPTMQAIHLAKHYKTSQRIVRRWLAEIGLSKSDMTIHPAADFAELAATLSVANACAHYGISAPTLHKWEKRTGVMCQRRPGAHPVAKAKSKTKTKVVKPPKPAKPPRAPKEKPVAFARVVEPRRAMPKPRRAGIVGAAPLRDTSRTGQAAEYLRRFAPVYRCNDVGAQSIGGKFWRYGNSLPLTDAELMERAAYKGFDPDAWARIAA